METAWELVDTSGSYAAAVKLTPSFRPLERDAIRNEAATGQAVGGTFHTLEGTQYARALESWLGKNPNASAADRSVAQWLLDDLRSALAGK